METTKTTKRLIDYEAIAAELKKTMVNYRDKIAKSQPVGEKIACLPTNMNGYYRITVGNMLYYEGAVNGYDACEEWDSTKFVKALANATYPTIECYIDCSANAIDSASTNYIINFNF